MNNIDLLNEIAHKSWDSIRCLALNSESAPNNHGILIIIDINSETYCITGRAIDTNAKSEVFALDISKRNIAIEDENFFILSDLKLSFDFLSGCKQIKLINTPELRKHEPNEVSGVAFLNLEKDDEGFIILASEEYPTDIKIIYV